MPRLVAGLAVATMVAVTHLFIRPPLAFFSADPEGVELGVLDLHIRCTVNFTAYVVMHILDSFTVGIGSPVFAMANSLLQALAIRLGLSLALACWLEYGFISLCLAEAVSPFPSSLTALVLSTGRVALTAK